MKISRESRRSARALLRLASEGGKLDAARTRQIADALVASRPRGYFGTLKEFSRLVRLESEKRHAVVETAAPLAAADAGTVESALRAAHGPTLTTEFRHSPGLLGGMRVRVGSDVVDGSVRARLETLKQSIS